MVVCASDFDTTGFCNNCLNVGCGDAFNSAPILSNVFFLKEHVASTVTSSLTRNLSEICIPVNVLLLLKELNTRKPSCKVVISSLCRFQH